MCYDFVNYPELWIEAVYTYTFFKKIKPNAVSMSDWDSLMEFMLADTEKLIAMNIELKFLPPA